MEISAEQQAKFNEFMVLADKIVEGSIENGLKFIDKCDADFIAIGHLVKGIDQFTELTQAEKYRAFKSEVSKHKATIHELRLRKGLTVQEASNLSGISVAKIKRWEANGGGRVAAHEMAILLQAYGRSIDHMECTVPTNKQVIKAILSGASTVVDRVISVDVDKVITLMKSEGFNVGEIEALCSEITKRPAVSSSVSA